MSKNCRMVEPVTALKKVFNSALIKLGFTSPLQKEELDYLFYFEREFQTLKEIILSFNIKEEIKAIMISEDEIIGNLRRKGLEESKITGVAEEIKKKDEKQKVDSYVKHTMKFLVSKMLSFSKSDLIPYETHNSTIRNYIFYKFSEKTQLVGGKKLFIRYDNLAPKEVILKITELIQEEGDLSTWENNGEKYNEKTEKMIKNLFYCQPPTMEACCKILVDKDSSKKEIDIIKYYLNNCFDRLNITILANGVDLNYSSFHELFMFSQEDDHFCQRISVGHHIPKNMLNSLEIFSMSTKQLLICEYDVLEKQDKCKILDEISKNKNISNLIFFPEFSEDSDYNFMDYSTKEDFLEVIIIEQKKKSILIILENLNLDNLRIMLLESCSINSPILSEIIQLPMTDFKLKFVEFYEDCIETFKDEPSHNITSLTLNKLCYFPRWSV